MDEWREISVDTVRAALRLAADVGRAVHAIPPQATERDEAWRTRLAQGSARRHGQLCDVVARADGSRLTAALLDMVSLSYGLSEAGPPISTSAPELGAALNALARASSPAGLIAPDGSLRPEVREWLDAVLGHLRGDDTPAPSTLRVRIHQPADAHTLWRMAADPDWHVRQRAVHWDAPPAGLLDRLSDDPDPHVRDAAQRRRRRGASP